MKETYPILHSLIVADFANKFVGHSSIRNKDSVIDMMQEKVLSFADMEINHIDEENTLVTFNMGEISIEITLKWAKKDNGSFNLIEIV